MHVLCIRCLDLLYETNYKMVLILLFVVDHSHVHIHKYVIVFYMGLDLIVNLMMNSSRLYYIILTPQKSKIVHIL